MRSGGEFYNSRYFLCAFVLGIYDNGKTECFAQKFVLLQVLGDGCAISQASADMMLDLIIGKRKEEALHLSELFLRMIKGSVSESELDELEEAGALIDISHMPARVKCAVLGWHTMESLIDPKLFGSEA